MFILVSLFLLKMLKALSMSVVILLLMKVIDAEDIKKNVQLDVLLVIASSLGIGVAMTKTGLADLLASGLIMFGEPIGVIGIIIIMYLLTSVFTEFITNSAAAELMFPIGLDI